MTIAFAVIVTIILIVLFWLGALGDMPFLVALSILGFIFCFVIGTLVAVLEPSPNYPTSLINLKVVDIHQDPSKMINVYVENGDELHFNRLRDIVMLSAKEVVYETGRKNLFGFELKDCFKEEETLKLNNQ